MDNGRVMSGKIWFIRTSKSRVSGIKYLALFFISNSASKISNSINKTRQYLFWLSKRDNGVSTFTLVSHAFHGSHIKSSSSFTGDTNLGSFKKILPIGIYRIPSTATLSLAQRTPSYSTVPLLPYPLPYLSLNILGLRAANRACSSAPPHARGDDWRCLKIR